MEEASNFSSRTKMEMLLYVFVMSIHLSLTLFDAMVVIFLCREWFKAKSVFKTSYFYILNYGYFVDIIFSIFWVYGHLTNYSPTNPLTPAVIIAQWFAQLDLGLWNAILGFNRCTALAFPTAHNMIWSGKTLFGCFILLIVTPFIIDGYSFQNSYCKLYYFDSLECADQKTRTHYTIAFSNIFFGITCLIYIIIGVIKSPKHKIQTKHAKLERNLIIQTLFFSTLLILIFTMDLFALYHKSFTLHTISYICYIIQFYAAIILLFFISPCFRHGFAKFYMLDYCFKIVPEVRGVIRNFHSIT